MCLNGNGHRVNPIIKSLSLTVIVPKYSHYKAEGISNEGTIWLIVLKVPLNPSQSINISHIIKNVH